MPPCRAARAIPGPIVAAVNAGRRGSVERRTSVARVFAACSATIVGAIVLIVGGSGLGGAIVGACLVGAGQGTAFALALSFFASRSADAHVAAEMSGTGQSVGYLIAAASPFLAGIVHDATGGWKAVLVGLALVVVVQTVVGAVAGSPATIDRADFGEE